MENQLRRVELFGLPIDIINDNNFEQIITKLQISEKQEQIKFLSYRGFISTLFSREKKIKLKSCALVIPTSLRIHKAVNFVYNSQLKLFNQFNFIIKLMAFIEQQGGSVYIIGGKNRETLKAESNLKASFPGIKFVGRFNGNFKRSHEKNLIEAVRKASPSLLLTGEGLRSRDNWLFKNKELLSRGISLYSSECFQIITGKKNSKTKPLIKMLSNPLNIFDIFTMFFFYPFLILQRVKANK